MIKIGIPFFLLEKYSIFIHNIEVITATGNIYNLSDIVQAFDKVLQNDLISIFYNPT